MLKPLLLIAHRGYSSEAPENTFAAFDLAIERGYRHIEFDVQLSRDGVPVIIHDETLERTTSGVGLVAEHSYAELAKLEAGSWFAESFADQRVPSLVRLSNRLQRQRQFAPGNQIVGSRATPKNCRLVSQHRLGARSGAEG